MTRERFTPRRSRKATAEIYRRAAQRLEEESDYACCYALINAGATDAEASAMQDVFCGDGVHNRYLGHWMAEQGENRYGNSAEVQDRRILALCFMAAITERP